MNQMDFSFEDGELSNDEYESEDEIVPVDTDVLYILAGIDDNESDIDVSSEDGSEVSYKPNDDDESFEEAPFLGVIE